MNLLKLPLLALLVATCPLLADTYHIDFDSGDDAKSGKRPEEAWKHAPGDPEAAGKAASVELEPGDVVQFRSGVVYRGNIVVPASGEKDKPIVYRGTGWGEGRAIMDGSELVTGWKKCTSAEEAQGNSNFANLFHTRITADSPFLLNLHEQNPAGDDEFLWVSQEPNPANPFFNDRTDSFRPVERENLTTTTITAPDVFTSTEPNHFQGASILIWVNPNFTRRFPIESYDPAEHRVTFPDIGSNALYADERTQFFAIYNSPHAIDQPGEYFVGEPDSSGERLLLLWPRSSENLDTRISRSVREQGVHLGAQSHVHVEGFEIRKFAGADDRGGCGIATASRGAGSKGGYVIRNNRIAHNMSGGRGYGGIYLDETVDALVEGNEVVWNNNHRGIFVTSGENIIIRDNRVEYSGKTAVVMYGGKRSQILNNRIAHVLGTHANALTLYIACENILVAGNVITDASNPITFQDSGPLYFINNVTDGGDMYKNVNEWPNTKRGPWTVGKIVFLNNTFVNADKNAALNLGKDAEKEYIVINNILDGLSLSNKSSPSTIHTHNIYTGLSHIQGTKYGWTMGTGETEVEDLDALLMAPEKSDYRLRPGGPALGAGTDVSAHYPTSVFPDVDFEKAAGVTKPMHVGAAGVVGK